jgi:hypothetical protein
LGRPKVVTDHVTCVETFTGPTEKLINPVTSSQGFLGKTSGGILMLENAGVYKVFSQFNLVLPLSLLALVISV